MDVLGCVLVINSESAISRALRKATRWQIVGTLAVSLLAFLLAGSAGLWSALGGGLSAILGGLGALFFMPARTAASPGSALLALLKAEAIKIAIIALVLLAIFKFYEALVPLALIGGLACAALISGAAMRSLDQEENK